MAIKQDYNTYEITRSNPIPTPLESGLLEIIEQIRADGFAVIPNFYSPQLSQVIREEIDAMMTKHPEHVQAHSDLRIFGAENLSSHVAKFKTEKLGIDLANAYWREKASAAFTLAAKMAWTPNNKGSGEGWHRDSFFCQFKLILYLNDVDVDGGPFQYIRHSHKLPFIIEDTITGKLGYMNTRATDSQLNRIITKNSDRLVTFTAPRGTLIIADTSGLHRGMPIRKGCRYALTNYYYADSMFGDWMRTKFKLVPPKST